MELFIKVWFYIACVGLILRMIMLGIGEFPRETARSTEAISILIVLPFLFWAAVLLWG